MLLLTYDIVRLYPSIKHELCYALLEKHLQASGCRHTSFIVAALRIILNRNYCKFNGQTWRQRIGFATGISCGVEVANLFIYALTRFVFRRHGLAPVSDGATLEPQTACHRRTASFWNDVEARIAQSAMEDH